MKNFAYPSGSGLAFAALPCVAGLLLFAAPAKGAVGQELHGHVPAAAARLKVIDPLPASQRLNLAVGLPLRNTEALANLLRGLYNPASPGFHQYLTPAQFAEKFGATEQDYQAVIAFASTNNLKVTD